MSLDKKSQLPLYAQLMKEIKDQIRKGTYKEGDQIPTEGELSAAYQVSRITVRRTIEELCSQGFLVKRQGKGTFVEIPKIYRKIENDNNMSFSEACRSNGRKPSSHIISCHIMEMQEWQQDFFKPEHTKIYHIERITCRLFMNIFIFQPIFFQIFRWKSWKMDLLHVFSIKNII